MNKPSLLSPTKRGSNALLVTVNQGDLIPFDGEVVSGLAMVDESAIVGVSTPVLVDESTGRNQVLKDTLVVEGSITIRPMSK